MRSDDVPLGETGEEGRGQDGVRGGLAARELTLEERRTKVGSFEQVDDTLFELDFGESLLERSEDWYS